MSTIVTRAGKGSALTWIEADANFTNLNTDKVEYTRLDDSDGSSLVGFLQSGTGAIPTTVQSKLQEFISVKDFGAVGDGVTDDTAALQAALNNNRICFVPPGKYRTTSELIFDPDVNRNGGFVGLTNQTRYPYASQGGSTPSWDGLQESIIFYDGPSDPIVSSTSTTSLSLLVGVRGFTIATGLTLTLGQPVTVYRTNDHTTSHMSGVLTTYNSGTGAVTATIDSVTGTGTFTDWTVLFEDAHAVFRASAEVVGVEPAATYAKTIWGMHLEDILLDANNKAGYGLFCARVQDLRLDHLRVRGATVAGISLNGTYSGSMTNCRLYLNYGRGLEMGAADDRWGWTAQDKLNAFYMRDLHTENNGYNSLFRESNKVLLELGCGFYYGPHRGTHATGVVSENNFGTNILFKPSGNGNTIIGVYTERGNRAEPTGVGSDAITLGYATKQWGMIYVGVPVGVNHNQVRDGVFAGDNIWLTGTEPTIGRREGAFELSGISLVTSLTADWGNYRLVNCNQELESALSGTASASGLSVPGGIRFPYNGQFLKTFEEGTWVPNFAGATVAGTGWVHSVQTGSYQRIGNRVFFNGRVSLTSVSADATGQIVITGLPFTSNAGNAGQSAVTLGAIAGLTTAIVSADAVIGLGTIRFGLSKRTAASTTFTSIVLADLSATTTITFTGQYIV